jgi:hypothetical protein
MSTATSKKADQLKGAQEIKFVRIDSIKRAKYNPKTRTKDMGRLIESIEQFGLICPVTITKSNDLVDGHRRLAACESLGWTHIQANVAIGDQADLYREAGSSVRALRGNETLQVYLKEPRAVGARALTKIKGCESACGRSTIQAMAAGGFSMATWDVARRICLSADQETPVQQRKVLLWLLKHRCSGMVERAMRGGVDTGKIMSAVKSNKPIQAKYSIISE